MFRTTMELEDVWELMLMREFQERAPQRGFSARDLADRMFQLIADNHEINAYQLLEHD